MAVYHLMQMESEEIDISSRGALLAIHGMGLFSLDLIFTSTSPILAKWAQWMSCPHWLTGGVSVCVYVYMCVCTHITAAAICSPSQGRRLALWFHVLCGRIGNMNKLNVSYKGRIRLSKCIQPWKPSGQIDFPLQTNHKQIIWAFLHASNAERNMRKYSHHWQPAAEFHS